MALNNFSITISVPATDDLFATSHFNQPMTANTMSSGDILQPMNKPQQQQQVNNSVTADAGSKGDLHSSLNKVAMQIGT